MIQKLFATLTMFLFALSSSASEIAPNLIKAGSPNLKKKLGNSPFEVTTAKQVKSVGKFSFDGGTAGEVVAKNPESLILGYPMNLLKKESVFGGVITRVSNKDNENLGGLKLSDLTPIHIKTDLEKDPSGALFLVLKGCAINCNESSPDEMLIGFPVVSVDEINKRVYVDLAQVGKELDIVGMLGAAEYFNLEHVQSNTVGFDFSNNTLIFDVESQYNIVGKTEGDLRPLDQQSTMVARYYLKLNPKETPGFEPRTPTNEVGFFTTFRSEKEKITRFHAAANEPIKYFIKNVPKEYQAPFAKSFDEWNRTFTSAVGFAPFVYEFVNLDDADSEKLVAGDIRYNVVEWDLNNIASYGGLGPSIANQVTGQNLSANVLIQGPTIVKLYKQWFGISNDMDRPLVDTLHAPLIKHKISLGKKLTFRIPAEDPAFQDDLAKKLDFERIPDGYTYERYMEGYFQEMLSHELGHNIGLRHNFRGNLGSDDSMTEGSVSRSIMEYLGRGFRYINRIAAYDVMAISYGYLGKAPTASNWFCTDENVPSESNLLGSAECSRDDATSDPISYYQDRLTRARDLISNRGSSEEPVWTQEDISRAFNEAVAGLGVYAASAPFTADQWTNFFGKLDRPQAQADVPDYMAAKIDAIICDPSLAGTIAEKATPAAKEKTAANIKTFQEQASKKLLGFNGLWEVFNKKNITCLVQ